MKLVELVSQRQDHDEENQGRHDEMNSMSATDDNSDPDATPVSEGDSRTGGPAETPPALSLVDQRIVDKSISELKAENKRTAPKHRKVICVALFVLLAIVAVVAIVVPLTRPATPVPAPPLELKSDWSTCSTSSECRVWADGIGCCSGKYSGGVSKCTPLSPWFDELTNECIIKEPVVSTSVSSDASR